VLAAGTAPRQVSGFARVRRQRSALRLELGPKGGLEAPGDAMNGLGIGGQLLRRGVGPAGDVGDRLASRVEPCGRQGDECRRLGDDLGSGTPELAVAGAVDVGELVK
jgi:hypothetical protein